MKRSDMLEIMTDTFIKYATSMSTTRDKMSYVLNDMEKAGILPPEIQKEREWPFHPEKANEWEPEVET